MFKEKDSVKGRNSNSDVFCKKGVLKGFAIQKGKLLCWVLFLIKLQVFSMQLYQNKKNSGADVLPWVLQNFAL